MKAYDYKIALLKSVLKTVMDPPGGLNHCVLNAWAECYTQANRRN